MEGWMVCWGGERVFPYNVSAARVAGKSIAVARLANRERRDRRTELGAAGAHWALAGDDLDRVGESWGRGEEHAEEGGGGGELHFAVGGWLLV